MGLGSSNGKMAGFTLVSGKTLRCMALGATCSSKTKLMRASFTRIRSMATVSTVGQTVECTKDTGKMESSTD